MVKKISMCSHCKGTGIVEQETEREPYSILRWRAGNEYDVIGASVTIYETCKAASAIAEAKNSAVCFDFLGVEVEMRPGDEWEKSARTWWLFKYDETPEESFKRR